MTAPLPIGVTASISPVLVNVNTRTFAMPEGMAVVTFHPVDVNNPGIATLYDSAGNVILTINAEGYETFQVPLGGMTYYFAATLGAALLAATVPSVWR